MSNNVFTKPFIAKYLNTLALEKGIPQDKLIKMSNGEIIDKLPDSAFKNIINSLIETGNQNFIMYNFVNLIRKQFEIFLNKNKMIEKLNFFKTFNDSGDSIVIEDLLNSSSRSGDIITDMSKISKEPENEVSAVFYDQNQAVDMKENFEVQKFATLESFTNELNKRFNLMTSTLDKFISKKLVDELKNYPNYKTFVIDSTGLTEEEISKEIQKTTLKIVQNMSEEYNNDLNESIDGTKENFTYFLNREDIAIIMSLNSVAMQEIEYFRNRFKMNMSDTKKDFGVNDIIALTLNENDDVIILGKYKFNFGLLHQTFTTNPGYALINQIRTSAIWWGSLFMKSVPGAKISVIEGGAPAYIKKNIDTYDKIKLLLENKIKTLEESLKNNSVLSTNKTPLSNINKKYLLDSLKAELLQLKNTNLKEILSKNVFEVKKHKYNSPINLLASELKKLLKESKTKLKDGTK